MKWKLQADLDRARGVPLEVDGARPLVRAPAATGRPRIPGAERLRSKLDEVLLDEGRPKDLRELARGEERALRMPGRAGLAPGTFEELPDAAGEIVRRLREIIPEAEETIEGRGAEGLELFPLEVEATILAAISLGAYDWIACACAGITARTFKRWQVDERPRFREFAQRVGAARAQARTRAEVRTAQWRPEVWLQRGPGRDKPGEPGWSEGAQKIELTGRNGGPIAVAPGDAAIDTSRLTDDELEQLDALTAKALGKIG